MTIVSGDRKSRSSVAISVKTASGENLTGVSVRWTAPDAPGLLSSSENLSTSVVVFAVAVPVERDDGVHETTLASLKVAVHGDSVVGVAGGLGAVGDLHRHAISI